MATYLRSLPALSLAGTLLAGCASSACDAPCDSPKRPVELAEPGLRLWNGERDTWKIISAPRLGYVTQVLQQPEGSAPNEILLVGTDAAVRTVAPPARMTWITFEDPNDESVVWQMQAADMDRDGRYEFFNRSGNWHPSAAYDADGGIRWRHALNWGVSQMAPGHLEGGTELDFVVGMNADGLRRLDADGKVIWQLPVGTVWDVELADLDGDGLDEILHSASRGHFFVRAGDGTVLSDVTMEPAIWQFELTRWGSEDGNPRVAYLRNEHLWLVKPDGTQRRSLALGLNSDYGRPSLSSMRLGDDEGTGLALLVDYRLFDRSVLNLYDAKGELTYQQVLPWSCPSLDVDKRDPEGEVLLLGCDGLLVGNGPHLSVYLRSLAINQAFEGPSSPNLLVDLRAIAWALVHLDREAEALAYAERAVAIAAAASDSRSQLAESLNTVGMVQMELGQQDDATSHLHRALKLVDPDSPEGKRLKSDIHYNLGRVLFAKKELGQAEEQYLQALAGTRFPADAAKAAYNLARIYLNQGRFAEAEKMILFAVEKDTAAYSASHAEVKRDLSLYAQILRGANRLSEAETVEVRLRPGSSTITNPAALAD